MQKTNSPFSIEAVTEENEEETIVFLKKHENFSMYLLGNLQMYGRTSQESPYSGNYKLLRQHGHVVAVFYINQKGTLLITSDLKEPIFPLLMESCQNDPLKFKGIVGKWDFCNPFWEYLKSKQFVKEETFRQKYVLYSLALDNVNFTPQTNVRALTEEDFAQWKRLRIDYLNEERLPHDITDEQMHKHYLKKVEKGINWGYFVEDTLVSIADLSSRAFDLGQVGGVYTLPNHRRKGYSRSVMQHLIHDCKELHKINKLIIFTGETSFTPQALYVSLGCQKEGFYILMFGSID